MRPMQSRFTATSSSTYQRTDSGTAAKAAATPHSGPPIGEREGDQGDSRAPRPAIRK